MAFIYEACRRAPLPLNCYHDPDSKVFYSFRYRAPAWTADTAKIEKTGVSEIADIVRPTTSNGFYYECVSGGITGSTEPTWGTLDGESTIDNDVEWRAIPDNLLVKNGDTITASVWEVDDTDVIVDSDGINGFDTFARVTAVPATASSFILRNVVTITRADSKVEEITRSLKIKIGDL